MWPIFYKILAAVIPIVPPRLRFRFWCYWRDRGRRYWDTSILQRVEGGMLIKSSSTLRPIEGHITEFVRRNTTVPIPIVIDNVTVDGETALVLSALPGEPVSWHQDEITADQAHKMSQQLSGMLAQVRALPPPHAGVCGYGEVPTPVRCERVGLFSTPYGPWSTVTDFHSHLIKAAMLDVPPEMAEAVWTTIRSSHSRDHRTCFTHNDLHPGHVLVDSNFNVTGIINWEAAAWMPEYWEYSKATFWPQFQKPTGWWTNILREVFPQYELERTAEWYIWQYRQGYS
ncbi:kinase-like protein [Trametopsis cervina]|nr:kinase-like protein [Trametopsis cervina]